MIVRLDKFLADMGYGTRSQVKKELAKGSVTVNGAPVRKPETKDRHGKGCCELERRAGSLCKI